MCTVAPEEETATSVIEIPVSGSFNVFPTANGASVKLVVAGVVSTSCDCVAVPKLGVIRMLTPLTAGDSGEKLSKFVPYGCRNSRLK
jgi:hypothetical protein